MKMCYYETYSCKSSGCYGNSFVTIVIFQVLCMISCTFCEIYIYLSMFDIF